MSPLLILLVAVLLVVSGVLVLRLPAALALLLAAIITALLTPSQSVYQHEVTRVASCVVELAGENALVLLQSGQGKQVVAGTQWVFRRRAIGEPYRHVGHAVLAVVQREKDRYRVQLQPDEPELQLATGDLVLHATQAAAANAVVKQPVGERVANGFGATCGKIGILIALASIIGKCLLLSGAASASCLRSGPCWVIGEPARHWWSAASSWGFPCSSTRCSIC